METTQGSLFYLTLSFNLPLLSVRKKGRQPQRVGKIKREAGGSFVWWVGLGGEGMKISGGSLQPDLWWQLYLLTPTSGDADTNPARSAPLLLEVPQSAAVRCASVSEDPEFSRQPPRGRATFLGFPATRRVFTLRAARLCSRLLQDGFDVPG